MTDKTAVTHVATTDISDMLNPLPAGRRMPMKGFDEEFVDIADYIIRITDRIWHERKVHLCLKYYSEDSAIHTLVGDIVGAKTVEANTHATLAAFPDRTLDGDNVIWSGNEDDGYYSSHLITSRMTNLGDSEFGPATGKRARIRTIADCVCFENQVVEEWLARDNAALVQQLGLDVTQIATQQARADHEAGRPLIDVLSQDRDETLAQASKRDTPQSLPSPETQPEEFAKSLFGALWRDGNLDQLGGYYDFRVGAHMPAGRDLYGTLEYGEYLDAFRSAITDISVSVDHIAVVPYLSDAQDIAVRWTLAGQHTADGLFGEASGAPVFLLGMSHWRVMKGRIREEWTVFDELAFLRQIEGHRLSA